MKQQQEASASGAALTGPRQPMTPSSTELAQEVSTLRQAMTGLDKQMSDVGFSVEHLPEVQ